MSAWLILRLFRAQIYPIYFFIVFVQHGPYCHLMKYCLRALLRKSIGDLNIICLTFHFAEEIMLNHIRRVEQSEIVAKPSLVLETRILR